jgi:hypothetical protein
MLGAAALAGGCAATGDDNAPTPAYGVVRQDGTSVDLLVRNATVERSKSVIRTWLTDNASGERYLTVTVLRAQDATTYICRAEFVADAETAASTTSGRVPGPYPAIVFDCPTGGPYAGG